jgi:nicotinamide riboside kinase
VDGGGKTWFVVRVSEFADKKSADTYGRHLKQQKIIDDFFVTNK